MSQRLYRLLLLLFLSSLAVAACRGDDDDQQAGDSQQNAGDPGDPTGGDADTTGDDDFLGDFSLPPGTKVCQEQCVDDIDCMAQFSCIGGRCISDIYPVCDSDDQCVASRSFWTTSCATDGECPIGLCVLVSGDGVCATEPTTQLSCDALGMEELQMPRFESPSTLVTVCGAADVVCSNGECSPWCETNADCADTAHPVCNTARGICTCTRTPDSCVNFPMTGFACGDHGFCGCADAQTCTNLGIGDACVSGVCTCSEVSFCPVSPVIHPDTTFVCDTL